MKMIIFFLLRISLIPYLVREILQKKRVTIIVYHNILPNIADIHFKTLNSRYNVITLKEFISAVNNGSIEKLPDKSLIITFDDGDKNNYKLISVFQKHKIYPTIFLCSGIIGTNRHFWWKHVQNDTQRQEFKKISTENRLTMLNGLGFNETLEYDDRHALTKNEIEKMKNFVDFQSHTVFHPILTQCSKERAYREMSYSKRELEDKYGLDIYALAFPNGDYSKRELHIAKEVGYVSSLSLDLGYNTKKTDLFRLKRICIPDNAGKSELIVRTSGIWDYIKKQIKCII